MSQKPIAGYTTMQEEYGAGGPPPYGPPQPTFQTTNTTVVVNQPVKGTLSDITYTMLL